MNRSISKVLFDKVCIVVLVGMYFAFTGCGVTHLERKTPLTQEEEVLSAVVSSDCPSHLTCKVHYKTIVKEFGEPLSVWLKRSSEFWTLCKGQLDRKEFQFTEEDQLFVLEQFDKQKPINLKRIKGIYKKGIVKRKFQKLGNYKTTVSSPVIFKNGEYALIYQSARYGGQFTLFKKIGDDWVNRCGMSAWIE